jgi:hypothetical protein
MNDSGELSKAFEVLLDFRLSNHSMQLTKIFTCYETQIKFSIETKSHNLCLGKFYIIRSQEKNLNQNRGSNSGSGSNFFLEIL